MDNPVIVSVLCTLIASTGFWTLVTKVFDKKSAKSKMILGLAHDRIIALEMEYIKRGSVSQVEYENLRKYLYEPYKAMGGNGTAERLMADVDRLPIVD